MSPLMIQERAELLHSWSTEELAEIADTQAMLRDVVHNNVCPSNGTIARRFNKRHPDQKHQLLFNIHLNYPTPPPSPFSTPPPQVSAYHSPPNLLFMHFNSSPMLANKYHSAYNRYTYSNTHDPGSEGWGDDIGHYYVVEDMLKLDPEQILWLKENAPLKGMVETFVKELGEWFENNGETWCQTLEWVLKDRGEDVGEVYQAISDEELGIATCEE